MQTFEEFSPEQSKLLDHFVTNTKGSVFVLKNLPEVIKGALFSRYSRSTLGLKSLLLKEFIGNNEETAFESIAAIPVSQGEEAQSAAIKKAQSFYDRILDGYGDDSIGELGGAHLALENVSMIAAKMIEDSRVGGSPLEKSTRYIYFDQKVNGNYLFYREPVLMTSAYRELYLATCNMLFETYSRLVPTVTAYMEKRFPKSGDLSPTAYTAALRAKVLDALRGLLPASTLTNVGLYGNGRFFEYLIQKMNCHDLAELQETGKMACEELAKVIPSFVRRADPNHKHFKSLQQYREAVAGEMHILARQHASIPQAHRTPGVRLVSYDKEGMYKVAAAMLYPYSDKGMVELIEYVKKLPEEALNQILDAGANARDNRRHKAPRAFEEAHFTFEFLVDFGAYRDLQRHRLLTQERQLLSCDFGYCLPPEITEAGVQKEYIQAMEAAKASFDTIRAELPAEAQYVVPMAYNVRWYFTGNLREYIWLTELRSSPAGHPSYRYVAQRIAKEIVAKVPQYERLFKFVDFDGYDLGRLDQEVRRVEKGKA